MKSILSLQDHQQFIESKGEILFELIGGSTLYGLSTPESDVDYRGVFTTASPVYDAGLKSLDSIVMEGEVDACYYSFKRFLELLRKTNTQSLDMLCAPLESYSQINQKYQLVVDTMRQNFHRLIDTKILASSLKGYVFSEMRLATGERTGRLGGKRKLKLDELGFSPKNFVQILRLCYTGCVFFNTGKWVVDHTSDNPQFIASLMHIKTQPQEYTLEDLKAMVDVAYQDLEKAILDSTVSYKFDVDFAGELYATTHRLCHYY